MIRSAMFCGLLLALAGGAVAQDKDKDKDKKDEKNEKKVEVPPEPIPPPRPVEEKPTKQGVLPELVPFQGSWRVVKAQAAVWEIGATESLLVTFVRGRMMLQVENLKPLLDAQISVDTDQPHPEIDIYDPRGKTIYGIYKFDKDGTLTLCLVEGEEKLLQPRPKEFASKSTTKNILLVLERVPEGGLEKPPMKLPESPLEKLPERIKQ